MKYIKDVWGKMMQNLNKDKETKFVFDEDDVYHRILIRLSLKIKAKLTNEGLSLIKVAIQECIKAHNWQLHDILVDDKHIAMIIQIDPNTVPQDMIELLRDEAEMQMENSVPQLKQRVIFDEDFTIETTDKYSLGAK